LTIEDTLLTTKNTPPFPRLVVFDVEGVLVPKRRYLLFEASRRLSIASFIRMLWAGLLYETAITSLETALKKVYKNLRNLSITDLFQLYRKLPLQQGVNEVFMQLKDAGCKTALISSGLPQSFIDDLASGLNSDYAFGIDLEVADGCLTGQISGDAIKPGGKALILKQIQEEEKLTPQDCALVADDRNNLPMFPLCSIKIGYNPDFLVTHESDVVVKGDLREIVPILSRNLSESHSISRRDLTRESIHMAGFLVAFLTMYLSLNRILVVLAIFIVTLLYTMSELARMLGINVPILSTITWKAAIQPEIYEFVTSPIFFAFGIMIAVLAFPPPASYASIAIFTLGDASATLIGKKFGSHPFPYNKGKKIEGTLFGFVLASIGASLFVNPLTALVGAAAGMIVESIPTPINDNITIPIGAGLTLLLFV
jgi:HAD superfamily phosphoserine phosphatase-like hydrolase